VHRDSWWIEEKRVLVIVDMSATKREKPADEKKNEKSKKATMEKEKNKRERERRKSISVYSRG